MATTQDRVPSGIGGDGVHESRVSVREALPSDLGTIADLEGRSFSNPWHPDTFRSLLKRDRVRVFVAEDPEEGVLGYSVVWWVLDQAELANLAVDGDHHGRGIGSALLDRVIAHVEAQGVETLFLEVRMSNNKATRLYGSRGFTEISIRKNYYQNPREDARILVKHLGNTCSQFQKMR